MKSKIIEMESEVQQQKAAYNNALQNLEKISDEIHKLREDQKLEGFHEDEVCSFIRCHVQEIIITDYFLHPHKNKITTCDDGKSTNRSYLCYQNSLSDDYELVDGDDDEKTPNEEQPEKAQEWSEIPLTMTESNSSGSSYSQHSEGDPEAGGSNTEKDAKDEDKKSSIGFSDWISKSSFRRQSLEDVFAQSTLFGKFGRSLERRNSETSVETVVDKAPSTTSIKKEFFLGFGRQEGLTDSQIENLFLPPEHL